ncbi:MAG: hypothetical protein DDT31_00459 [Syntrophomonadaceae bacterium]|nr:hypothetical protein [Bacillota bacterium]
MKNALVIGIMALGLVTFFTSAHAFIPGHEGVDIRAGMELEYGVRELKSLPPAVLRDAKSAVGAASIKLAIESREGLNVFLRYGIAKVDIEYVKSIKKIKVQGKCGETLGLGFKWSAPITDVGIPIEGMRVGVGYEYLIVMSSIDRIIKGGISRPAHPDSKIEIKKHEFSLFISEDLDFLTLYVGARYSVILDMEIKIPGKPVIDFVAKERPGIIIGADIPLGDLLGDIIPLPLDINLNFEVEAPHEASIRFGGSIAF